MLIVTRKKHPAWPWHGLTVLVLIAFSLFIWYSITAVNYQWNWTRIPQYFVYQAEEQHRAENISRVSSIEEMGTDSRVTLVDDDGNSQVLTVTSKSLHLYENDDVAEGEVIGVTHKWEIGPLLLGLWMTLWISVLSAILSLVIGLLAGLCRTSKNPTLHDLSTLYVEIVRGTPLLVMIMMAYFFIATVFNLSREVAAVATLALCTGAYVAEIMRAGIQSIDKGQMEAARSLGLNSLQAMWHVILPQAFKRVLPPLTGQFISLVKDTSLLSVISITELVKTGRELITSSFAPFEIWLCVAALYLVINLPLSRLAGKLERRLGNGD